MARRRLDVQMALRQRRRSVLLVAAVLIGLVAATVAVLRSPMLDVDSVLVAGSNAVDRTEVARASGIRRGDAMIDVDPASAREAVMALPGVASARVERDWPGRVRITVTDEVPLIVVEAEGSWWEIASGGRVIERLDAAPGPGQSSAGRSLPKVSLADRSAADGPAGDGSVADGEFRLIRGRQVPPSLAGTVILFEQMSTSLRDRVATAELARDGSVTLVLVDDAGRVAIGATEDLPSKLLAVDSLLAGVDLTCMDVLDVREPSRPTVNRRAGCRANPPTVGSLAPAGDATDGTATAGGGASGTTAGGASGRAANPGRGAAG